MIRMRPVLLLAIMTMTWFSAFPAFSANAATAVYTKHNPGSIAILGNPAGKTNTSNPLAIALPTSIPETAVITKVTVLTGSVSNGPGVAVNAITSYNLTPPGKEPAAVMWKNAAFSTQWTNSNSSIDSPAARGTWFLSMTGFNPSPAKTGIAATTSHRISSIEFEYAY